MPTATNEELFERTNYDSERRKALARQALEERMKLKNNN
jgi:hypothetical protein